MISLVIFTHSDYSYLWKIIEEKIINLYDLNPIFISNINNTIEKPKGFKKYIEYDDKLCYAKRWINILTEIDYKYILVVHDVQIILNCDITKIIDLVNIIDKNNIKRCSLNVFNGVEQIHENNIQLCNLNNVVRGKTFVPYDVSPAIWNVSAFLNLWNIFPNETYHGSELNNDLQNYCKKIKCYGIQKTKDKIYYCMQRPNTIFFKILNITIKGELLTPSDIYMDMKNDFNQIVEKYNLTKKIKINPNYAYLCNNFIPL